MKQNYSRKAKALVLFTAFTFLFAQGVPANAANKTITCYKGTTVKKVTAAKPKCPTGYTTTKPKATTKPVAGATVAFSGTYKGKLSIVWGDTYLQVTGVNGTGSGNVLGLTDMSGTASAAPAGLCDTFDAKGSIAGGGSSLNVSFDSSAKGCAEDESAPTTYLDDLDAIQDSNRFIPPNPPRQSPRAMWRAVKRAVKRWFHRGYHEDDGATL